MYLTFDLVTPVLGEWVNAMSFKRKMLYNWPTTTVEGHEVFDKLLVWDKWHGARDHSKIYKPLGLTVDKINDNNYDGLKYLWFNIKPWIDDLFTTIEDEDLADLIDAQLELDKTYVAHIRYETTRTASHYYAVGATPPTVTDDELIAAIAGGYDRVPDNEMAIDNHILDEDGEDPDNPSYSDGLLFAVLADKNEVVFERTFRTTGRTVLSPASIDSYEYYDDFGGAYKTAIEMEITYKRKASAHDAIGTFMFNSIDKKVAEIIRYKKMMNDPYGETTEIYVHGEKPPTEGFIARQLEHIEEILNPMSSSDLFLITEPYTMHNNIISQNAEAFVKVEGVKHLTGKEFVKVFNKAFTTTYKKEKTSFVVKLINVLIVFIAFAFAAVSGGGSLVALGTYLGYATIALMLFSKILTNMGIYGGAIFTGKVLAFLGNITKVMGFYAFISNSISAVVSGVAKSISNGVLSMTRMSTFKMLNTVTSWLNTAIGIYHQIADPDYEAKLSKKQAQLDAQEEKMEDMDYTSPKSMELIQEYFETNQWAEVNAYLDNIPYLMTEGKVEAATSKYY